MNNMLSNDKLNSFFQNQINNFDEENYFGTNHPGTIIIEKIIEFLTMTCSDINHGEFHSAEEIFDNFINVGMLLSDEEVKDNFNGSLDDYINYIENNHQESLIKLIDILIKPLEILFK